MKVTNYHQYFMDLASQCIDIGHTAENQKFARLELNEDILVCKAKIDTATPCMFVGLIENNLIDRYADNPHIHTTVLMLIAKKSKTMDFAAKADILKECEEIGYTVLSRIYKDKTEVKIQGFDRNSISFSEVFDTPSTNDVGVLFRFVLHRSINPELYYDPAKWQ